MAKHIWSILSKRTIIDRDSNLLSFYDVLEAINLSGPGPKEYKKGSEVNISLDHSLTTFWVGSVLEVQEKINTRVTIIAPDKKIINRKMIEIDLTKQKRHRSIMNFRNFIVRGPGTYNYKVDIEVKKNKRKSWRNVANIPMEVIFHSNPQ